MKRAFTLVEALVCIAVVLFLAWILFPPGIGHNRGNARRASCQSNLKLIGLAFALYQQDANDKLPLVARTRGWVKDVQPYISTSNRSVFQCPETSGSADQTSDYFYNARLNGAELSIFTGKASTIEGGDGPDDAPLSSSLSLLPPDAGTNENSFAQRHLGGANYLFVDGHVKWIKPEKVAGAAPPKSGVWTFAVR